MYPAIAMLSCQISGKTILTKSAYTFRSRILQFNDICPIGHKVGINGENKEEEEEEEAWR
jgi:hypothetical protein